MCGNAVRQVSSLCVLLAFIGFGLPNVTLAAPSRVEIAAAAAHVPVQTGTVTVNGAQIYFRDVGRGEETLVLLHGFPETGDAFAPAIAAWAPHYRLIIPDLRGFGMSQRTVSGYDTKNVATDVKDLMDHLGVKHVHLVGYNIGARVAYAFALQYPERLVSLTVAEALIEGLEGTARIKQLAPSVPRLQHFAVFAKADQAEQKYLGGEGGLVLSFMNSRTKAKTFTAADVAEYVDSFKRDRGMWAAFKYYEAFDQDAAYVETAPVSKIVDLPVLTIGCEEGSGKTLQRQLQAVGLKNVKTVVFGTCAHWIFEENANQTIGAIQGFIDSLPTAK